MNLSRIVASPKTGSQISADLTNVETDLTVLKSETSALFTAEASLLRDALDKIGKDARDLSQHPSPANLRATTTAVKDLKTVVQPVITVVQTICPSS